MPDDLSSQDDGYVELIEAESLWDGEMESFDVGDAEVLLLKVNGEIRAYDGICPHQSFSLVEGDLERGVLTCRAHEWQFDALSGAGVNPIGTTLTRHAVRLDDDGIIRVRLCARPRAAANVH
jgi:nitrite reductase/ring-hydroxylating ferredoxin subunit